MSPHNPDVGTSVTGEQFRAVRAFLQDHKEVHFVWFDFGCLPQKLKATDGKVLNKLNPAEEVYFKKTLSLINLLYVHGKVLVLLDAEYSTRFWCLYEAFLASHKFDGTSLVPEQSIEGTRTPFDHLTLTTALPSCRLCLESASTCFHPACVTQMGVLKIEWESCTPLVRSRHLEAGGDPQCWLIRGGSGAF